MPVVGEFHGKYWRTRANPPPPPGPWAPWMYPGWQSSVAMMAIWGVSFAAVRPAWEQARWLWGLARRLWWWRVPAQRAAVETWIGRLEALDPEQRAVIERVVSVLQGPIWEDTRQRVRACATTPKFHQPEQWLAYSRAVKANAGQAQNIWRHVRVVHELRDAHPELTNPEAHLLTELGYHGFVAMRRSPDAHVQ